MAPRTAPAANSVPTAASRWRRTQWPAALGLLVAVFFTGASGLLRLLDSPSVAISDSVLADQHLGVYADVVSRNAWTPVPSEEFAATGGSVPTDAWTLTIAPGRSARAAFTFVQLDAAELWDLNIRHEILVLFALPPGAELEDHRELRVGGDGSCASWSSDEGGVAYSQPTVQRTPLGEVLVSCVVPAVGDVNSLMFELRFRWPDAVLVDTGIGRRSGGYRLQYLLPTSGGYTNVPPPRNTLYLLPRTQLRLDLPEGERLSDAFPAPTEGQLGSRSWAVEQGLEVEYTLEKPAVRALVQPSAELTLLLAGVTFGVLPSLWRRKRFTSGEAHSAADEANPSAT
jgi:hypothetical protein